MLWLGKLYVWKWQISTINKHFSGGIVGKWQKFRPFSNNLLRLFENGRKQTINHLVGILLENGRNFCRFLTTTTSCLKTAENKPSTILWGLCWKTAEISAVFQQLVFGRFPTTQNVSAVFQQRGFGRFPTIFFGRFPHPLIFVLRFKTTKKFRRPFYESFTYSMYWPRNLINYKKGAGYRSQKWHFQFLHTI